MTKKLIILVAVLAAFVTGISQPAHAQERWDRQHETCAVDSPFGALCIGLVSYTRMDDPSDSGGECPGTDVAASSAHQMFGLAQSALFDGSNAKGFISYGGGGFGGGTWTLALWVYPTSATVTSTILSTMDSTGSSVSAREGLTLDLYYTGSALHARARSYMQDTDTLLTTENLTNLTANAWHLVVFQSAHSTIRKLYSTQALKVSVDNGAFTSTAWTSPPRVNVGGHLVIGKSDSAINPETRECSPTGTGFTGHMQALYIYDRALSAADIALLWRGGIGRDFPFAR